MKTRSFARSLRGNEKNAMKHVALEDSLKSRIRKRRIVEGALCVAFFVIAIAFFIARENSRVVEEIDYGFIKRQQVTYNDNLLFGVLIGFVGFIFSAIFLICDLLYSKTVSVEVSGNYVTFYRGLFHTNLYINGEYKDGLTLFGYYLEAPLPDGTKVTVSLGKWSSHISFSNGYPSVDV